MKYKEIPKTDIKVSILAVGTWQFGESKDCWGPGFDRKECIKVVHFALDNGINLFDTAEVYSKGESETILGEALKGRRSKAIISAKCPPGRWKYSVMKDHLTRSLKRMRTDYIDIYQIHWPKIPHVPWTGKEEMTEKDYEEIFISFEKLIKEGLIRTGGVSNFRLHHLQKFPKEALELISINQVPYSLLWRCYENEKVVEFCKQNNIGFFAYSPLAQGLLSGRFKDITSEISPVRKDNLLFNEPIFSKALTVVKEVENIASTIKATPSQVALRWLMEKNFITSVLAGIRKLSHLEDNLGAITIELKSEHLERLEELSLEFNKIFPPGLEMWKEGNKKENLKKLGLLENGEG